MSGEGAFVPPPIVFNHFQSRSKMKPMDLTKFSKHLQKKLGVKSGFHDPQTFIHTGSYALNYRISNDFFKGVPLEGKVTVFAGEQGCLPETAKVRIRAKKRS
jgi:hypothetical protein